MENFLSRYDVKIRPIPPGRQAKKAIERRHRTVRLIFLRFKHSEPETSENIHAIRAILISNGLTSMG